MTTPSLEPLDKNKLVDLIQKIFNEEEPAEFPELRGSWFEIKYHKLAKALMDRFGSSGQRVVKWPLKIILTHVNDPGGCMCIYCVEGRVWNEAITACQEAFEEARRGNS